MDPTHRSSCFLSFSTAPTEISFLILLFETKRFLFASALLCRSLPIYCSDQTDRRMLLGVEGYDRKTTSQKEERRTLNAVRRK